MGKFNKIKTKLLPFSYKIDFIPFELKKISKTKKIVLLVVIALLIIFIEILPSQIFNESYCTVITAQNGDLLSARIATDGQYRFPPPDSVPVKFALAIETFEDKRFRYHLGFDPIAFFRAAKLNLQQGRIVSGGSTITMQVMRLSRKGETRTIWHKIIETVLAIRLEFSYSKNEILKMYAAHAPFGGNVVGLETASWRYFSRTANQLSWAETAMLAVLPNSPTLINTNHNRKLLLRKRNRLLKKLNDNKIINNQEYSLAIDEPIPTHPAPFPQLANHLLMQIGNKKHASIAKTTIQTNYQIVLEHILEKYNQQYKQNQINNLCALILDTETGKTIAYVGNIATKNKDNNSSDVDIIRASRSTGSILKPFLYAAMLTEGEILPNTLILDIPTRIGSYSPQNYNQRFDGAVPASKALSRSLNIPAVRMLRKYGVPKFYNKLEKSGMTTLNFPSSHYGLSLILGGSEASLWELCGMYASLGRSLKHYNQYGFKYFKSDFHPPYFLLSDSLKFYFSPENSTPADHGLYSASAIWFTFLSLQNLERPNEENGWREFSSSEKIAWKTGTSFGFRDAWAVGITPKFVVGVWVGNADGEGRPGLVGVRAAAPILFEIFNRLPDASVWFTAPSEDMISENICKESGMLATSICPNKQQKAVQNNGERSQVCSFHQLIHTDSLGSFRVKSCCESIANMHTSAWFILPPVAEKYYKQRHPEYLFLPPFRADCIACTEEDNNPMQLLYPYENLKIYVPTELSGKPGKVVFEAAHRNNDTEIFWFIDKKFVAKTTQIHEIELYPPKGEHLLTLIDIQGNTIVRHFEIINDAL